ncbi:MAG: nicotinate (nicotinamide) nucleotide adenylyltransferase [Spirochaetales bacterium]|nr:nicotinate (nicotinamide) nucleotide adenylyltransferase [Spirochaetales bacterium]
MRTAIIGGSFNPPHIGHLQLAEEVKTLGFERIIFVPSNISAHKPLIERPSALQRLEMTRLAADIAGAVTEDCEIRRGGVSYTIETVQYCKNKYRVTGRPAVVIGDDLLKGFSMWKCASELAEQAQIIIAHRVSEQRLPFEYAHVYMDNYMLPVSSSQIRALRAEGKAYRFLVPPAIFDYIEDRNLYERD